MASEAAQRHVTEISERDTREMGGLIRTAREVQEAESIIFKIGQLSEEWSIFDANVFIVRILVHFFPN